MTFDKHNVVFRMSNNQNFSDYYEESSTDEESGNGPTTVSSSSSAAGPSSAAVSAVSSASSSAGRPSTAVSSVSPASSAGQSSSGGSFVAVVAPRTDSIVPQAPATIARGELENPAEQSFMGLYTYRDVNRLENWASLTSSLRGTPGFSVSGPPGPNSLFSFMRANLGARWEQTLLSPLGEIIIFQLRAYINGFSQLTSFERGQWSRLYSLWTMGERAAQLRRLAERGGFLEIE